MALAHASPSWPKNLSLSCVSGGGGGFSRENPISENRQYVSYWNAFLFSVATENAVCFLGDCNPSDEGNLHSADSTNSLATCGDSCADLGSDCVAWVTLTRTENHYCYRYRTCPDTLVNENIMRTNKRIYTCYSKLLNCKLDINQRGLFLSSTTVLVER